MSLKKIQDKLKDIIKGSAKVILIRKEEGTDIPKIPLTLGALGVLITPSLAAVRVATALLIKCINRA
jgi:hypothetical protein